MSHRWKADATASTPVLGAVLEHCAAHGTVEMHSAVDGGDGGKGEIIYI